MVDLPEKPEGGRPWAARPMSRPSAPVSANYLARLCGRIHIAVGKDRYINRLFDAGYGAVFRLPPL